ncbi:MAG: phosphatase PAP2 family protein [Bacteroidota bacterium]|nr:phosphatase PAP2 family protein [Bacteroidota bacterium]
MKLLISEHKWFYIPYLCLIFAFGFVIVQYSKWDIHFWFNQHYSTFGDYFFKYLTYLGDGAFLPLFVGIMALIRFRFALLLVLVFLLSGLAVQLLKHFAFSDISRPAEMIKAGIQLHLVPGVKMYSYNSFPSGHSATAFGVLISFAFVFKQGWAKMLMLIFACLIAYSRVYLSQHYLIDIMAGSFIGVITAHICYLYMSKLNMPWLDKNLFTITKSPK